jgi:hypothetical protein
MHGRDHNGPALRGWVPRANLGLIDKPPAPFVSGMETGSLKRQVQNLHWKCEICRDAWPRTPVERSQEKVATNVPRG